MSIIALQRAVYSTLLCASVSMAIITLNWRNVFQISLLILLNIGSNLDVGPSLIDVKAIVILFSIV